MLTHQIKSTTCNEKSAVLWRNKIFEILRPCLLLLILSIFLSCDFPKDPSNTYNDARANGMKVGVVNNPPFTNTTKDTVSGREVQIIAAFAKQNNIAIEYVVASETNLINLLKNRKIQIVIGGFTKKTVWKKHAGLTAAYDGTHVFLIPKGENRLVFELETYFNKNLKQ
ncbi:transporter substrate-binding domain-containing protein [Aequorivita viscosa]|nr:transporter substrate-binding domain-containing protein [Aequorivita viscosa]